MDNFSVRFKPLAASVSTNIVDYFKLVFAETETYSVPKHNLCVPKRKNFCAPLKAFNCAFKSYFLAPFKKMAPPPGKRAGSALANRRGVSWRHVNLMG